MVSKWQLVHGTCQMFNFAGQIQISEKMSQAGFRITDTAVKNVAICSDNRYILRGIYPFIPNFVSKMCQLVHFEK